MVEVTKPNTAQKGVIRISKSGEVFSSVTEADGIYQPVFTVKGLAGAVYEITAAEDIITPDGTLRYAAGEVVDTVTTDETGLAESKPLYLGKYEVREITAPYRLCTERRSPHGRACLCRAGGRDYRNSRRLLQRAAESRRFSG